MGKLREFMLNVGKGVVGDFKTIILTPPSNRETNVPQNRPQMCTGEIITQDMFLVNSIAEIWDRTKLGGYEPLGCPVVQYLGENIFCFEAVKLVTGSQSANSEVLARREANRLNNAYSQIRKEKFLKAKKMCAEYNLRIQAGATPLQIQQMQMFLQDFCNTNRYFGDFMLNFLTVAQVDYDCYNRTNVVKFTVT